MTYSVRRAIADEMARIREGDDDHFYGGWAGGSKAKGGGPIKKGKSAKPGGAGKDPGTDKFDAEQKRMAEQVSTWTQTEPWKMSKEDIAAGKAPGIEYKPDMGTTHGGEILGHAGGDTIKVSDKYFDLDQNARQSLLYHEAGHKATRGLQPKDMPGMFKPSADNPGWQEMPFPTARSKSVPKPGDPLGRRYLIPNHAIGEVMADQWQMSMMFGTAHLDSAKETTLSNKVMSHGKQWGFPSKPLYKPVHSGPMNDRKLNFELLP